MSPADDSTAVLSAFFREVESEAFWRQLSPSLHIGEASGPLARPSPAAHAPLSPADDHCWRTAGYIQFAALDPALVTSLAQAIVVLRSRKLHPTFIYVYDETWSILDALGPYLSQLLGHDFVVLADAWAWHIDPRTDPGGWAIHRGWYEDVRNAAGSPDLVNVWVALSESTQQNGCIHLVPLFRDPHYPTDLHNLDAIEHLALPLPVPAGSALAWNANAAHWGGSCDPAFQQSRISISFTVRRRKALAYEVPCVRFPLTFRQRLDLIAQQFETYGEKELDLDSPQMRWAAVIRGVRQSLRR